MVQVGKKNGLELIICERTKVVAAKGFEPLMPCGD